MGALTLKCQTWGSSIEVCKILRGFKSSLGTGFSEWLLCSKKGIVYNSTVWYHLAGPYLQLLTSGWITGPSQHLAFSAQKDASASYLSPKWAEPAGFRKDLFYLSRLELLIQSPSFTYNCIFRAGKGTATFCNCSNLAARGPVNPWHYQKPLNGEYSRFLPYSTFWRLKLVQKDLSVFKVGRWQTCAIMPSTHHDEWPPYWVVTMPSDYHAK